MQYVIDRKPPYENLGDDGQWTTFKGFLNHWSNISEQWDEYGCRKALSIDVP